MLIDISDVPEGIRISSEDAECLGKDLLRAAEESDDHRSIQLVDLFDVRNPGLFLRIQVTPREHPEHVYRKAKPYKKNIKDDTPKRKLIGMPRHPRPSDEAFEAKGFLQEMWETMRDATKDYMEKDTISEKFRKFFKK